MKQPNNLEIIVKVVGRTNLAKKLNVSSGAIYNWEQQGHMPTTEYTGKTNYTDTMLKMYREKVGECRPYFADFTPFEFERSDILIPLTK